MRRSHSECFELDPGVPYHSARAKKLRQFASVQATAQAAASTSLNDSNPNVDARNQQNSAFMSPPPAHPPSTDLPSSVAYVESHRCFPTNETAANLRTPNRKRIVQDVQAFKFNYERSKKRFDPVYLRVYPYKEPVETFPDYANGRAIELSSPVDAMSANADQSKIVVAGTKILRIFNVTDDRISQQFDLKANRRRSGLLYAPSNVAWSKLREELIATCSPMGGVVIWNATVEKNERDIIVSYRDHSRSATAVHFHRTDENLLISGSVDSLIKLYDLRSPDAAVNTYGLTRMFEDTIRDLTFGIHAGTYNLFYSAGDVGILRIWDMRITNKPILQIGAHHGYIGSIALNAQDKNLICTGGGRDRLVKVWDLGFIHDEQRARYTIETVAPVNRVYWRPDNPHQIVTCAVVNDTAVHVWDVRRSHVPYASFEDHADGVTDIWWSNLHPARFVTSGKDGCLILHRFNEAFRPLDFACDVPHDQAPDGLIAVAVSTEYKSKIVNEFPPVPLAVRTPATFTVDTPRQVTDERSRRQRGLRRSIHYEPYRAPIASDLAVGMPDMAAITLASNRFALMADGYAYTNFPARQLCLSNLQTSIRAGAMQQANTWRCLQMLFYVSQQLEDRMSDYYTKINLEERYKWHMQVLKFEQHWAAAMIPIFLQEHVSWMFPEMLSAYGNSDAGRQTVAGYRSAIEEASRFNTKNLSVFDANEFYYGFSEGYSAASDKKKRTETPHTNDFEGLDEEPFEMKYVDLKDEYWFREPTENWKETLPPEEYFCNELLRILNWHMKKLDLQTVVSLITMLGPILQNHIDIYAIETWTNSYLEMLERSKLYSAAARIRKTSIAQRIGCQTREGTEMRWVHANCGGRGIITNGVCTSCKELITPDCAVCNTKIVGMLWSCGECLHSFHPEHAAGWFEIHEICAARGCACHCTASTWPLYPQAKPTENWTQLQFVNQLINLKKDAIQKFQDRIDKPILMASEKLGYNSRQPSVLDSDATSLEGSLKRHKTMSQTEQTAAEKKEISPREEKKDAIDVIPEEGADRRRISERLHGEEPNPNTPMGSWTQQHRSLFNSASVCDTPISTLRKRQTALMTREDDKMAADSDRDRDMEGDDNDEQPLKRKKSMPIEMQEGRSKQTNVVMQQHRNQSTSPVAGKVVTRVMERLFKKTTTTRDQTSNNAVGHQSDTEQPLPHGTSPKQLPLANRHASQLSRSEVAEEVRKNSGSTAGTVKLFPPSASSHSTGQGETEEEEFDVDADVERAKEAVKPRRKSEQLSVKGERRPEARERKDSVKIRTDTGFTTPSSHRRGPVPAHVAHSASQFSPRNSASVMRTKSAPGAGPGVAVMAKINDNKAVEKKLAAITQKYFAQFQEVTRIEYRVKFDPLPIGCDLHIVDSIERLHHSSALTESYEQRQGGKRRLHEYVREMGKIIKRHNEPGECWIVDGKGIVLPIPISYDTIRDTDALRETLQRVKRKREKLLLDREARFWMQIGESMRNKVEAERDDKLKAFYKWSLVQAKKHPIETNLKNVEIPKNEILHFCSVFMAFNRKCEIVKILAEIDIERISREFANDFLWKRSHLKKLFTRNLTIFTTTHSIIDQVDSSKLFEKLAYSEKDYIFKEINLERLMRGNEEADRHSEVAASMACRTAREIHLRYESRDVQKIEFANEVKNATIEQMHSVLTPKKDPLTQKEDEYRQRVANSLHHGEPFLDSDFCEPAIELADSTNLCRPMDGMKLLPTYRKTFTTRARQITRLLFSTYLKFMLWSTSVQNPPTLNEFTAYMRKNRRFYTIFMRIDHCWRLDDIYGVFDILKSECDKLWAKCFENADKTAFDTFNLRIINIFMRAFKLPRMIPPTGHSEREFYEDLQKIREATGDDSIRLSRRVTLNKLITISMQLPLLRQQMQCALREVQQCFLFQQSLMQEILNNPLKHITRIDYVDWQYFAELEKSQKGIFKPATFRKLLETYEAEKRKYADFQEEEKRKKEADSG